MRRLDTVVGTVTSGGNGRYQVRTDSGMVIRVASSERWSSGARVIVVGGAIIGPAGTPLVEAVVYHV